MPKRMSNSQNSRSKPSTSTTPSEGRSSGASHASRSGRPAKNNYQKRREKEQEDRRRDTAASDRSYKVIKWAFILLIFSLIAYLGKILIVDRPSLVLSEYNPQNQDQSADLVRGTIYDAAGQVLAVTQIDDDGNETREYPYGEAFAHAVGYIGRGRAGLEDVGNDVLTSTTSDLAELARWTENGKTKCRGIRTTMDASLQQYIYDNLKEQSGAVVVTDPSTGKVLALVSTPSFNPETVTDEWETISQDEDSPLFNRATMGLYPPGSTFKIITALAMRRYLPDYETMRYECPGYLVVDNEEITCYESTAHGDVDLSSAMACSCNGFFSEAGIRIGGSALTQTAASLYLGSDFDFILPEAASSMNLSDEDTDFMVAETAFGQGETLVTPFYLNMLTCAIANDGVLYKPYLVDAEVDPEGKVTKQYLPKQWGVLMTGEEASFLRDLMEGVTKYGTAAGMSGQGYDIYGKSGTAQVAEGDAHSWFTGCAQLGDRKVCITVIVEHGSHTLNAKGLTTSILRHYFGLDS